MSSSHSTVTYTYESDINGSPWGIYLMIGGSGITSSCFTPPLSPDYSTDSEPIEDDPQEADHEDDPEEEPSEAKKVVEEELPASAVSTPAIPERGRPYSTISTITFTSTSTQDNITHFSLYYPFVPNTTLQGAEVS
nr:hypothetical protein [Tanacetum cinerariifolium]